VPWRVLAPLVLAGVALYLLLPKPRTRPVAVGAILGLAAVALGGILLTRVGHAPLPESILFYAFSAFAILGGAAMLTQRNPARAAISFALVVMNVCGLFLLQGAPFLMAATIIIYAGAIIVTFLFVLMLAQQRGFSDADDRTREPFLATFAGFVLLGTLLIVIDRTYPDLRPLDELVAKADDASTKDTLGEINASIGDKNQYVAALLEQDKRLHGSPGAKGFFDAITNLQADLNDPRPDEKVLKMRLRELADVGHEIQHEQGAKALKAANVANLGTLLYSNHLLPVELGGTLLLVATIGAIAITGRGPRRAA
jgi:NADH:ubiquinone oxidoreductase subunit 6 (subunit J)